MLAETSPVLQLLNEKLDVMTLDPIEKKLYESRMKLKSDILTISESQFKAGIEIGTECIFFYCLMQLYTIGNF